MRKIAALAVAAIVLGTAGHAHAGPSYWQPTNFLTTSCATGTLTHASGHFTGSVSACSDVPDLTRFTLIIYGADGGVAHPWYRYARGGAPTPYTSPMPLSRSLACVAAAPNVRLACVSVQTTEQGTVVTAVSVNDPLVKYPSVRAVDEPDPNCATCV